VLHRMAGKLHLTRVDGDSVFVLRIVAQRAGYVGLELLDFRRAESKDPRQQRLPEMCRLD
jgi:hypothetical protein